MKGNDDMGSAIALESRHLQPELMDDPSLDPVSHRQALNGLRRINWWSCSTRHLWNAICQHLPDLHTRPSEPPLRILDIACGGGDNLVGVGRRARSQGIPFQLVAADISPLALEKTSELAHSHQLSVETKQVDILKGELGEQFDIVMSSLFLHHLSEAQSLQLLKSASALSHRVFILQDLVRSRLGYALAWAGTRILSRSPIVHFDGPRSVEGAFSLEEIRGLADQAGLADAQIERCWPERFLLTWRPT